MAELGIRLVCSLAVVVGLLLLLTRVAGRRFKGRTGAPVQVLHRQPISRGTAVAVVTVGTRVLVLGTTEQQVTLLAEVEPDEVGVDLAALPVEQEYAVDDRATFADVAAAVAAPTPVGTGDLVADILAAKRPAAGVPSAAAVPAAAPAAAAPSAAPTAAATAAHGALTGSVLSPQTWRLALSAATGGLNRLRGAS